jgi:hypothetical protein
MTITIQSDTDPAELSSWTIPKLSKGTVFGHIDGTNAQIADIKLESYSDFGDALLDLLTASARRFFNGPMTRLPSSEDSNGESDDAS